MIKTKDGECQRNKKTKNKNTCLINPYNKSYYFPFTANSKGYTFRAKKKPLCNANQKAFLAGKGRKSISMHTNLAPGQTVKGNV